MDLHVRVVSQHPPGGRCTLYAGYAEVLAAHLAVRTEVVISTERDAHGTGFPSLLVNGQPVQPADGVILMPADLCAILAGAGLDQTALAGLAEALEAPPRAHDGRLVGPTRPELFLRGLMLTSARRNIMTASAGLP